MTNLFERNRTDWSLAVAREEIMRVVTMVQGVAREAKGSSVVWVTKSTPDRRLWIIRDRHTLAWVSADAAPGDPDFALPIPEHFIEEMAWFVGIDREVSLFCDETENIIVCESAGHYIAIDHPVGMEFRTLDLPYLGDVGGGHDHAVAQVPMGDVRTFAHSCTNVPTRLEPGLLPFVAIEIGEGALRWTMDWRRHGLWRVTRSMPAETFGSATATFYPWTACRVLRSMVGEGDVRVYVGGPHADFVYFMGEDWGVRIMNDHEPVARWHSILTTELVDAGCTIAPWPGRRLPTNVVFTTPAGRACTAVVIEGDGGGNETVRFAHVVATGVEPTAGVLAELNALNAALTAVKVTLRDGEVRLTLDFDPSRTDELDPLVAGLDRAIAACQGLGEFMPLFAD